MTFRLAKFSTVIGLFLLFAGAAWSEPVSLAPSQTIRLNKVADGFNGTLAMLSDSRLKKNIVDELWGKGDWTVVLSDRDPIHRSFLKLPPKPAKLVLSDAHGKVIAEMRLRTSLARVELHPGGCRPGYLLSEDFSAGLGSYAGVKTVLISIVESKFVKAKIATASGRRTQKTIELWKSLKSDWKLKGCDKIYSVTSWEKENSFLTEYSTYVRTKAGWTKRSATRKQIWESDQGFPPESDFPPRN